MNVSPQQCITVYIAALGVYEILHLSSYEGVNFPCSGLIRWQILRLPACENLGVIVHCVYVHSNRCGSHPLDGGITLR